MSFDSVTFWLFFAVTWSLWRLLPFAGAKAFTLFASLFFYAWWNPWYLTLIGISAGVDYLAGARIHASENEARRRAWLLASLVTNLGLLAVFKYGPFALHNASFLAGLFGAQVSFDTMDWVIPVGISFYTFQTLSYSIDIYRGVLEPAKSFRDFFLFVSFFPQLVAGPIVRARELLPQLAERRPLRAVTLQTGLYYVIGGLFLKIVVADNLAPAVGRVFSSENLNQLSPVSAWLGVVYFGCQIFADFAGYSAIAIGLAYLMGLEFPLNFRYPYISRSLSEFWTRWHMTLSRWLRDYLYITLGGSRRSRILTYRNLALTMLLGGLWHGAAWTFVAWGALHGLGLCVERALRSSSSRSEPGRPESAADWVLALARMLLVFVFVHTAWVFFRSTDFTMAGRLLERMYVAPFREPLGLADLAQARHLVLVLPIVLAHLAQLLSEWYGFRRRVYMRAVVCALWLFFLTVVRRDATQEFIYFQF